MASLTSQINVVVDTKTKNEAAHILEDLGLSMSSAINIFLKQVIKNDGLPFEIKNRRKYIEEETITDEEILEKLREAEEVMANGGKMYSAEEVHKRMDEIIKNAQN